jgi:hypothetical protein
MNIRYSVVIKLTALALGFSGLVYAVDLSPGDIIAFCAEEGNNRVVVLHRDDNYRAEEVTTLKGCHKPSYYVDRLRGRVYLENIYYNTLHYLDLKSPPYVIKDLDFLPEDAYFECAARDGSYLIFSKFVPGDIYAEENPAVPKTGPGWEEGPLMLFKYDLTLRESKRLTYFYTQGMTWPSDDGEYIAYRRLDTKPGMEDGQTYTIVFCESDGMRKSDLRAFFYDYDPDLYWDFLDARTFAPHRVEDPELGTAYLVYFEELWPNETRYEGVFEYYSALIYYGEDGVLNCKISKNAIDLPEGIAVRTLFGLYSNDKELYLNAQDGERKNFLGLYDIPSGKLTRIPNIVGIPFFVVY